jgi:RNA polymerase sigma-70 factor (ECF subfamily)
MSDERNDNEKDLLESAIRGEASAFGLLYDKYQPKLFRFIFLKVSQREEAEDLTHQVFLSAWRNIETFQDQGLPLSSWLYKIARNKVIDYYRTRKQITSIEDVPEEILVLSHDSGSKELENKMEVEAVYKALGKLSSDYQEIILMRFVEGLSPKEISQITGRNRGAVRVLQFRALRQLRRTLEKNE